MSDTFLTQEELLEIAKTNADSLLTMQKTLASNKADVNVLGVVVKIRQTMDGKGTTVSARSGVFPEVTSSNVTQADANAALHVLNLESETHKNIVGVEILSLIQRDGKFEVISSKAGEMGTPDIVSQVLR